MLLADSRFLAQWFEMFLEIRPVLLLGADNGDLANVCASSSAHFVFDSGASAAWCRQFGM